MYKSITLKPRMSEKAYALSQTSRTYVFDVPLKTNKQSIAHAVEQQFDVVVTNVNVMNIDGKAKRLIRKGGRAINGRENDYRKAYVTLAEGNSLPIFAAIEEADAKQDAVQEKVDKAASKKADKEAKKAAKNDKETK
jgi:large subunit ribosomal protein L23